MKHVHAIGHLIEQVAGRPLFIGAVQDVTQSKLAEEALRESERESRLIVNSIPGLVATLTPAVHETGRAYKVEAVNNQILEYCGLTPEEIRQWGTGVIAHPEDLPRAIEVINQSIASGEPFEIENHRVRRFDGVYRWFQVRGLPLRDSKGRIVRWYVLLTDIDARKRAEEALKGRERNLKLIIDTIPALAWSARPDGSPEFLNQHYLDFIGLSAEQASDWDWTGAVHPDDLSRLTATWQRIMASQEPGEAEARLRRYDGEYRWFLFRANPLRDEKGDIVKWYGINTDIEDRRRAEDELRRSEAFLAEGQRLSRVGSFSWRVETDEITWSEELYRIFEFDRDVPVTLELIGSRVHPEDIPLVSQKMDLARRNVNDHDYAIRLRMPDGRVKYLRTKSYGIRDRDGRLAIQDATEHRLSEEALTKARSELAHVARVAGLATLTASIAHEVNQPLSGIVTNAGTCLRTLDADPPNVDLARETARRIIRDGNRASDVITRLRALFSKKELTLESLDLNEATREVISLSLSDLQRNRVILQSELADNLPRITGDRVQLQQVILNLLRNGSDAMVGVDDRPRQLLVTTERDEGDRVRLSVKDVGTGFAPQDAERLFEAFHTTKKEGMGIGLSVSRSIIERHHGCLWAKPNDGAGATFSFSIPYRTDTNVQ